MEFQSGLLVYFADGKRKKLSFSVDREVQNADLRVLVGLSILPRGKRVRVTLSPARDVQIERIRLRYRHAFRKDDRVFLNGYQSWTESREYRVDETVPPLSKLLKPFTFRHHLKHFGDYYFRNYSYRKGRYHGFTYAYLRTRGDLFTLTGSLNEDAAFTVFRFDTRSGRLDVEKDCEGFLVKENWTAFDLMTVTGTEDEVFADYLDEIPAPKGASEPTPAAGWTSWYQYYTDIDQKTVLDNLSAFRKNKIPLEYFQIDDGWQPAVGDWLKADPKKFPKGMKPVAAAIRRAGYRPGLWIAPFVCVKNSEIYRKHLDWLVKNDAGKPLVIGNNDKWGGRFYALDVTNAEVRKYLTAVFDTVLNKWGFDMIKADFLYAACVDPTELATRGQIMRSAMKFLRKIAGQKVLLGCGVPLASAFGLADYCRIGCDTDTKWEYRDASVVHYRERVSTVNSILDTIGRRRLDGGPFRNDPDVYFLRQDGVLLNEEQKQTLFFVNQLFGSLLFTSDHVGKYSPEQMARYLSQFPLKKKVIRSVTVLDGYYRWKEKGTVRKFLARDSAYKAVLETVFTADGREYVAYINLGPELVHIRLKSGQYFDNRGFEFYSGGRDLAVPPYGSVCLLVFGRKPFEIAGSTGHLFAGCDVETFQVKRSGITLKLCRWPKRKSVVYIRIPPDLGGYKVNGKYVKAFRREDQNLLRVSVGE